MKQFFITLSMKIIVILKLYKFRVLRYYIYKFNDYIIVKIKEDHGKKKEF